jgi:Ni2+-binding GTPase involved in maturation of urease and hydrogenase
MSSTSPPATDPRRRAGHKSDLLVINKIDLAPMVGASLE